MQSAARCGRDRVHILTFGCRDCAGSLRNDNWRLSRRVWGQRLGARCRDTCGGAAGGVRTIGRVMANRLADTAAAWGQRDAAPCGDTGAAHTTIGHVGAVTRMVWTNLGSFHFSYAIYSYFSSWISSMATQLSSMATQLSPQRDQEVCTHHWDAGLPFWDWKNFYWRRLYSANS